MRARANNFRGQVEGIMPHHLKICIHGDDFREELVHEKLVKQLLDNMGSDKPTRLDFGGGNVWNTARDKLEA